MICGEMCVLLLIYSYVAVCMYCAVRCVVSLLFVSICYFLITRLTFLVLFCALYSILCILCFCIVLCVVSPFVHSCLFDIFVKVYRPLPPGGNPIAITKYRIISYITSYHITTPVIELTPLQT